jgi:hypothetical protein
MSTTDNVRTVTLPGVQQAVNRLRADATRFVSRLPEPARTLPTEARKFTDQVIAHLPAQARTLPAEARKLTDQVIARLPEPARSFTGQVVARLPKPPTGTSRGNAKPAARKTTAPRPRPTDN